MKLLHFLLLFLIIIGTFSCVQPEPATEFEKIMANVRGEIRGDVEDFGTLVQQVEQNMENLKSNGSWKDIPYGDSTRTNWLPAKHLERVSDFAKAYTMENSEFYGNEEVHQSMVQALQFWNKKDPKSDNWWHNEIASPKALGRILIMLRAGEEKTPSSLENELIQQMARGDVSGMTGANKLDIAIHYIYRGCLLADKEILQTGVDEAFYPIQFTTEEGLQHDFSYMQHGPQLQISSYGLVFIRGEVKVAGLVQGTSYALKGKKLDLLSKYIRYSYLNILRGPYIDFSVMGRGISRKGNVKNASFAGTLKKFMAIDTAHDATYRAAIDRIAGNQPPGYKVDPIHTHYWRSDFTIHKRKDYSFSVRTASTRTKRTERGNGENLKGYFLSDGATNIRVNGDEYYNIFPVWDWNKIPGVTSTEVDPIPKREPWGTFGSSTFTGGVSDSLYGVTTYDLKVYGISGKKGWFFFDDAVVCMGTGINGTSPERVVTTVNQALLDGNVTLSANGKITQLNRGAHNIGDKVDWVLHDSVGYFFPKGGNLKLSNQSQSGNWYKINHNEPDEKISKDIFKLWFDHGIQPQNKGYTYIVAPDKHSEAEMGAFKMDDLQILKNNPDIQAVKHQGLDILQVVFYQPGTFTGGDFSIQVDQPCALMIKNANQSNPELHIADPAQKVSTINVSVKLPGEEDSRELECDMPDGVYKGSTLTRNLKE